MPRAVETRKIVDPRIGAKLSGKIGNRSSIGVLFADDEAPGKTDSPLDPAFGKRAQSVIGRYKYELYRNAHVGGLFTDREFMDNYSRLWAVDTALPFGGTRNIGYRFYKSLQNENNLLKDGWAMEGTVRQQARNLSWGAVTTWMSPEFASQLSFVRRVNTIENRYNASYRWWPESWIRNWGPGYQFGYLHDYDRVLQNQTYWNPSVSFTFARNITLNSNVAKTMERYREIDFDKINWTVSSNINTSQKVLLTASVTHGDEIRFIVNPFLGRLTDYSLTATFRPFSRLQSILKLDGNRFRDPVNHAQEFNVKIMRSTTTYQFTPRLLIRNITELNTGDGSNHTVFENILITYRVNSGTVFYIGYDDRFKEGPAINAQSLFGSHVPADEPGGFRQAAISLQERRRGRGLGKCGKISGSAKLRFSRAGPPVSSPSKRNLNVIDESEAVSAVDRVVVGWHRDGVGAGTNWKSAATSPGHGRR